MSATRGAWPLVGRDGELAEIAAARADPECPAVLISAPAGVGKSRLAREAFAAAEADGARSMWAQATASSATIPLGALAPVIPAELRSGEPLALVLGVTEAMRARAEQLVLSVRTVETYVYRAMQKRGVESRHEL
jgi:hypothetical protein